MKNTQISILLSAVVLVIMFILASASPTMAENDGNGEETQAFTEEQLAQLLAPIGLYPDELIAQVLLASTYPLEIVMADRWVQQNKDLRGNDLATALERESWDPSVKALVNFPTVLAMLSQKLDLTTKLGDAFLEQKEDVMDTIQELRKKAIDAGNLKSSKEQQIVVKDDKVFIEPAESRVVYVPTYDPHLVYGPWWYPAYPPYYFYTPPYPGIAFSFGVGVRLGLPWGYAWGDWDWYNHDVFININRNLGYNRYFDRSRYIRDYERRGVPIRSGPVSWHHDPGHRRGVAYKDKTTAREFGQLPARTGGLRSESRGFSSPSRPSQGNRSVGADLNSGRRGIVQPGGAKRIIRKGTDNGGRATPPKPTHDGAFTSGYINGSRVRKFSERGSQSVGGNAAQVGRRPGIAVPRINGGDRGGEKIVPRDRYRSDEKRR